MTATQAYDLGYRVKKASFFEVGLVKGEIGIRTWFCADFDRKLPELDHPLILKAIQIQEDHEERIRLRKRPQ